MDDFIYLLALIAWVAFAFYRKSQKKSEAARQPQRKYQPENDTLPLPTLEEILLGKEPVPEVQSAPVPEPVTTDGIPPVLRKTTFEEEYNRIGITSVEEMEKPMLIRKVEQADLQEDEILLENDENEVWKARINLKQAVIYSEILNRPYV
jgi:hypothetical protein